MLDSNLLSLSYGRIVAKDINTNDGLLPESFETYQIVEPGDIVFRFTDLQNDTKSLRSGLVEERGIITSAYLAFSPKYIHSRFLAYLMRSYDSNKVFYGMGGGLRQSLKYDDIRRLPILTPPAPEQVAIADFLDRETGKIDALTTRYSQLKDRLEDRRSAFIDALIRRGPAAGGAQTDSGVPWIGAIPSHWTVPRIRDLGNARMGLTYAPEDLTDPTDGTLVLRAGNIQDGRIDYTDCVYVKSVVPPELFLRDGDLLICSRNGSPRLIGKNALIDGSQGRETWGAFMTVLRSEFNHYLQHVLNSSIFTQQIGMFSTSTINQLTNGTLLNMKVPLPPADERGQIGVAIEEHSGALDLVIAAVRESIRLLSERRSALITAAVTGELDVGTGRAT